MTWTESELDVMTRPQSENARLKREIEEAKAEKALMEAVVGAAKHQRDRSPGALPQLVNALTALDAFRREKA